MTGFNNIVINLESVRDNLASLLTNTEIDFLRIGEKLVDFTQQAKVVLQDAHSATGLLAGEQMKVQIDNLKEILNRINRYLVYNSSQLESNLALFESIIQIIQAGSQPIRQLERRVMELRMLGISTRIESAHLTSEHSSFDTLALDVNNLSDRIKSKIELISQGLNEANLLVHTAWVQIKNNKQKQDETARVIFDNINNCIDTLESKHHQSVQLVNTIMAENEQINNSVNDIVGSLQIHDITRQKLEHVDVALDKVTKIDVPDDQNLDIEHIYMTGDVCHLQLKQLTVTRQEMISAVEKLIVKMNNIVDTSQLMTRQTRELIENSDQHTHSYCTKIENGIDYVINSLRANAVIFLDMSKTTHQIAGRVEEMIRFIKDIKEIGTNLSLLALNAIINAEHLHHEGAALSVLANGIQHLAVNARSEIDSVARALSGITEYAEKLVNINKTDNQEQAINSVVDEMAFTLDDVLINLNGMFEDSFNILSKIEKDGESFTNDLKQTATSIHVHHIFDDKLNQSGDLLARALETIQTLAPEYVQDQRESNTENLWDHYSMQSERDVHDTFNEGREQDVTVSDDDFDDNIELF